MAILLMVFVIILYTLQSFFSKLYSDTYPGEEKSSASVFAIVCGVSTTIFSFCFSGFSYKFSWFTVGMGLINAAALYLYDYYIIKGSASGPYSILITFSVAGGIIIPVAFATAVFNDWLGFVRPIVILLIIFAVWLVFDKSDKNRKEKLSSRFIVSCFGIAIGNGIYGTLLDAQQRVMGPNEREEMVAITFLGCAIFSLIKLIVQNPKNLKAPFIQTGKSTVYLIVSAIISGLAIQVYVVVLPLVDLAVLYTIDNSSVLFLSFVLSVVVFKEKLTKKNILGCILLCVLLAAMATSDKIETFILNCIK